MYVLRLVIVLYHNTLIEPKSTTNPLGLPFAERGGHFSFPLYKRGIEGDYRGREREWYKALIAAETVQKRNHLLLNLGITFLQPGR